MTAAEMLARVRTMLDESSAGFWSDAEIYRALSDGQADVSEYLLALWKERGGPLPQVLRPLYNSVSATLQDVSTVTLPSDLLYPISVSYSPSSTTAADRLPCYIREEREGEIFLRDNTYLSSKENAPYCRIVKNELTFETEVEETGSYTLEYLENPSSIDGTTPTNPVLPAFTHPAIIQYAYALLLLKDQRSAESNQEYAKYLRQQSTLTI